MSLKEQAQTLLGKTAIIESKIYEIQELCKLVVTETNVNGEVIKYSDVQNQKIVQRVLTLITELQVLVQELP